MLFVYISFGLGNKFGYRNGIALPIRAEVYHPLVSDDVVVKCFDI